MAECDFVIVEETTTTGAKLGEGGSLKARQSLFRIGDRWRNGVENRICNSQVLNGSRDRVGVDLL